MMRLVSYKASSADYCRGCLMQSWDSHFIINSVESLDEAVKIAVDLDSRLEDREGGYDHILLGYNKESEDDGTDPDLNNFPEYDIAWKAMKAKKQTEEEERRDKLEAKRMAENEAYEKKQLLALAAKYPEIASKS